MVLVIICTLIYKVVNPDKEYTFPIKFLSFCLPLMSGPLYIPILSTFFSILLCRNNFAKSCWENSTTFIYSIAGIILGIIVIFFSYWIQGSFFDAGFFSPGNPLIKLTCRNDILLFEIKTYFLFEDLFQKSRTSSNDLEQWVFITIGLLVSGYILHSFAKNRPYTQPKIMKCYLIALSINLWGKIVLLTSRILKYYRFNGELTLFMVGALLIVVYFLSMVKDNYTMHLSNGINESELDVIHRLIDLIKAIETLETKRNSTLKLRRYITMYEERCATQNCPLKCLLRSTCNFTKDIGKSNKKVLLFQHVELLCKNEVEKHPKHIRIRIFYSWFLIKKLKRKHLAITQVSNCYNQSLSIEYEVMLYIIKKYVENHDDLLYDELSNRKIIIDQMLYKKESMFFKSSIQKVTLLYIDFWTNLLISSQENKSNLDSLSRIGKKITEGITEINQSFQNLQKMKYNDKDILYLYSDFLLNIINDKDSSSKYKKELNEIDGIENYYCSNQMDMDNDLNPLGGVSTSDSNQFILISCDQDSFGIITNISLGFCNMLGYTKKDIVGKHYSILLPEMMIEKHKEYLMKRVSEYNKNILSPEYSVPSLKKLNSYIISKSKYLVPILVKIDILQTEDNSLFYCVKMKKNSRLLTSLPSISECYVMTNTEFLIQYFTPNAITFLGLDSNFISGNIDITQFIKEFNEELLHYIMNSDEKTRLLKLQIKQKIQKTKFEDKAVLVTWKKPIEKSKINKTDTKRESVTSINVSQKLIVLNSQRMYSQSGTVSSENQKFFLTITEVKLEDTLVGYLFKFESLSVGQKSTFSSKKSIRKAPSSNIIDKKFIPESTTKFYLNIDEMSYKYKQTKEGITKKQSNSLIKRMAMNKLSLLNKEKEGTKKTITSSNSESSDGSYSESDFVSGSVHSESDITVTTEKEKVETPTSHEQIKIKEDYYHVDLSHVKLIVYNFKKKVLVETLLPNKRSQVEIKLNENEEGSSPPNGEQYFDDNDDHPAQMKTVSRPEAKNEGQKNEIEPEVLEKQIANALSKKESQPAIIKLEQASALSIFILALIGIGFIIYFKLIYDYIEENIIVIQKSLSLVPYLIFGQFYVRELVLINNENYTNTLLGKEISVQRYQQKIQEIFKNTSDEVNYMITTFTPLSKSAREAIDISNTTISVIKDDFSLYSYNQSFYSALTQTNTALFHIATMKIKDIIPTNKHVFFYLRNSLNQVYSGLRKFNQLYISELENNIKFDKVIIIIIFIVSSFLLVILYIILISSYMKVAIKKESYLEVFFDIEKNAIQTSLENCEFFNKKIQTEASKDFITTDSISYYDSGEVAIHIPAPVNNKASTTKSKRRKRQLSRETRLFKFKALTLLTILFGYIIAVFLTFILYLEKIKRFISLFEQFTDLYAINLYLYNYVREYLFDINQTAFNLPVTYVSDTSLVEVYVTLNKREQKIMKRIEEYPKDFVNLYNEITNGDLCHYGESIFNQTFTCDVFMAGAAHFGLNLLLSSYIERIRYIKNCFWIQLNVSKKYGFHYNLTLTGTAQQDRYWPSNEDLKLLYKSNSPIALFNQFDFKELNHVLIKFIYPSFEELNDKMKKSVNDSISHTKKIYLTIMTVFIIINLVWFLGIFVPFVNRLNQIIYKSKNMLAIIPKQMLSSISNIGTVLDIQMNITYYNKGKNKRNVI